MESLFPVCQSGLLVSDKPRFTSRSFMDSCLVRTNNQRLGDQLGAGGRRVSIEISELSQVNVAHALQRAQCQ